MNNVIKLIKEQNDKDILLRVLAIKTILNIPKERRKELHTLTFLYESTDTCGFSHLELTHSKQENFVNELKSFLTLNTSDPENLYIKCTPVMCLYPREELTSIECSMKENRETFCGI